MTMQAPPAAPLPVKPSMAQLWAQLDSKDREDVLNRVAKRVAEIFDQQLDSAIKALGLQPAPPARRLWYYYQKPLESWAESRAKYPRLFDHMQRDFMRLREREAKEPGFVAAP